MMKARKAIYNLQNTSKQGKGFWSKIFAMSAYVIIAFGTVVAILVSSNSHARDLLGLAYQQIMGQTLDPAHQSLPRIQSSNVTKLLKISSTNPRYLMDGSGKAVILAGSNYWNIMQDGGRTDPPPAFDFDAYVNFLVSHGLNYTKPHVWEQAWHRSDGQDWYIGPTIYVRAGPGVALDGDPKFDLKQFNAVYFDRLRQRVITLGQNGIYVGIPIFDKFSVWDGNTMSGVWAGHPFNVNNNINGINGDPTNQGNGLDTETLMISAITAYQEAYVKHLIDTLNDQDNVIWEVLQEGDGTYSRNGYDTLGFVNHFVDYIHAYEATKPKQHPVLFSSFWPGGDNNLLLASGAEIIAPNEGVSNEFYHDCPNLDGSKVVLVDTDHIDWISTDDADWLWRCVTRGAGMFAIMDGGYSDYDDQGGGATYVSAENMRYNMGWMIDLTKRMNLAAMTPQSDLCSTTYCLASTVGNGAEYLVFLPSGSTATNILESFGMERQDHNRLSSIYLLSDSSVTVDLSATPGDIYVEWFNPATGEIIHEDAVTGGMESYFVAPFTGSSVLYLYQANQKLAPENTIPVVTPTQSLSVSKSTPFPSMPINTSTAPIPSNPSSHCAQGIILVVLIMFIVVGISSLFRE